MGQNNVGRSKHWGIFENSKLNTRGRFLLNLSNIFGACQAIRAELIEWSVSGFR